MSANEHRRQAHRQQRGLHRVEDILVAAARVFVELGYDEATTAAIATAASISPGSVYQFFPNKEAIARALAARYTAELRLIHAQWLIPDVAMLPLPEFVDRVVDPIVAFNRANPAFMRLFGGSHVSPQLAHVLDALHAEVIQRIQIIVTARAPHLDPDHHRRIAIVTLQLALALLPLTLDPTTGDAMVYELKVAVKGYLTPVFVTPA